MQVKKLIVKLPHRILTDIDLLKFAKLLKIPHFQGVFMRNGLPEGGPYRKESANVNLDDQEGPGTHWCAYTKLSKDIIYFDCFGNLRPPSDLFKYLGVGSVKYKHERYQTFDRFVRGHLCLKFLCNQLNLPNMYCLYKDVKSLLLWPL